MHSIFINFFRVATLPPAAIGATTVPLECPGFSLLSVGDLINFAGFYAKA
jgi:hypothetical protein